MTHGLYRNDTEQQKKKKKKWKVWSTGDRGERVVINCKFYRQSRTFLEFMKYMDH